MIRIVAAALLLAVPAAAQAGQSATEAATPGSAQREALLNALRPSVEAKLGPDIEFTVDSAEVLNGWAFVSAMPQRRGGIEIDGAKIFPNWDDMDGLQITALLQFVDGRWKLRNFAIGATDVWYCGKAPPALNNRICPGS